MLTVVDLKDLRGGGGHVTAAGWSDWKAHRSTSVAHFWRFNRLPPVRPLVSSVYIARHVTRSISFIGWTGF